MPEEDPSQEPEPVAMGPAPHPEDHRPWTSASLPMTTEVLNQTKPYLEVVQNLGRDFKKGHKPKFEGLEGEELAEAKAALNNRLNDYRELRKEFSDIKTPEQFAGVKEQFNDRYNQIRESAGRMEPSLLEQHLPENSPLRTKLDPLTGGFRDPKTGLYADMKQIGEGPDAKNVLIMGGTKVGAMLGHQLVADVTQGMGHIPSNYQQALQLATEVKQGLGPEAKMETAGHSLGGGLANYAGLKLEIPATCFNAAALGAGCRNDIGPEKLAKAKELAVHVNVKGEFVSGTPGIVPAAHAVINAKSAVSHLASDAVSSVKKGVTDTAGDLKSTLSETAGSVRESLGRGAKTAREGLSNAVQTVENSEPMQSVKKSAVGGFLTRMGGHLSDAAGTAKTTLQTAGDLASDLAGGAKKGVKSAASSAADLAGTGSSQLKAAGGHVVKAAGEFKGSLETQGTRLAGSVKESAASLAESAKQTRIGGHIADLGGSLADLGKQAGGQIANGAENAATTLKAQAASLKEQAAGTKLGKAGAKAAEIGSQLAGYTENLGLPKGLGLPHQYGQSYSIDPVKQGVTQTLGNHVTNALEKAYNQFEAQQQQQKQDGPAASVRDLLGSPEAPAPRASIGRHRA